MSNGQLVVISGPSGAGKDTIISKVLEKMENEAFLSISMTTRSMRPGDIDGVDYYFVDVAKFEKNIADDKMLEYAKYGANYYGTPLEPVEKMLKEGKTVILNIEVQGGANVRRLIPEAVQIFVLPPSLEVLEKRLRKRGTDSEESILTRLEIAKDEIKVATQYDFIVVNDELEKAAEDVMSIIRANQLCTDKMKNKICEVICNA